MISATRTEKVSQPYWTPQRQRRVQGLLQDDQRCHQRWQWTCSVDMDSSELQSFNNCKLFTSWMNSGAPAHHQNLTDWRPAENCLHQGAFWRKMAPPVYLFIVIKRLIPKWRGHGCSRRRRRWLRRGWSHQQLGFLRLGAWAVLGRLLRLRRGLFRQRSRLKGVGYPSKGITSITHNLTIEYDQFLSIEVIGITR